MRIVWDDRGWDEYLYWQMQDKKTLKKINSLIRSIERTDDSGIGQTELLKGDLAGWSSARIDEKNRLVFRVSGQGDGQYLEVLQCKGHYSDS